MVITIRMRAILVGCAGLALSACSGSSGPASTQANNSGPASLSVSLIDGPVDDVSAVWVEISALWLKAADGGPAEELPLEGAPVQVNLLSLTPENAALLVDNATIEAGTYEWLAMDVNAKIDGVYDSYVETPNGWKEIFVPSGRVRLVGGFDAAPNEAMQLIFDWDLRRGLVHPPGLGGPNVDSYILKPAFRVIDTAAFGRLSGSIAVDSVTLMDNACDADEADLDVGNVIYIYAGHDVVPDDVDEEMDVEPLATVNTTLSDDSTAYEYSTLLPFGDYTVAFTCQAANDLADSNETGNENADDDTVTFFDPAVNITLSDTMDGKIAVVDF